MLIRTCSTRAACRRRRGSASSPRRPPACVSSPRATARSATCCLGFVPHDELLRLYDDAAVVVCSSYGEGLPLCVIEAMAHGRPVVATTVGGIPQLVEDGRTGYLVPPRDAPALRSALERVLADADLRRSMGRAGRERISRMCSWDVVTDATLAAYDFAA